MLSTTYRTSPCPVFFLRSYQLSTDFPHQNTLFHLEKRTSLWPYFGQYFRAYYYQERKQSPKQDVKRPTAIGVHPKYTGGSSGHSGQNWIASPVYEHDSRSETSFFHPVPDDLSRSFVVPISGPGWIGGTHEKTRKSKENIRQTEQEMVCSSWRIF